MRTNTLEYTNCPSILGKLLIPYIGYSNFFIKKYIFERGSDGTLGATYVAINSSLVYSRLCTPTAKSVSFRQASPIYDTLWFPFASLDNPATFCFLVSSRDAPVKLLDGNDGRVRMQFLVDRF